SVPFSDASSDEIKEHYFKFIWSIKGNLKKVQEELNYLKQEQNRERLKEGIQSGLDFINGIEILLDETEKEIDINDSLSKVISLLFSQYYRNRGYDYKITTRLSSDIPTFIATQDNIAFIFFSLLLPLRKYKNIILGIETKFDSENDQNSILINIANPEGLFLNDFLEGGLLDTGVNFALAEKIVKELKGTIQILETSGRVAGFLMNLPHVANRTPNITASPMEGKAVSKTRFIEKTARELRQFIELLKAIGPAVSIFGSARIKPGHPVYETTMDLAYNLSQKDYAIVTGGGPGVMEAANKGVPAGKISVGLRIELSYEKGANPFVNVPLAFKYFFARKMAFVNSSQGFICMQGGFGTLDELFEVLNLKSRGYTGKFPIILFGKEFYSGLFDFLREAESLGYLNRPIKDLLYILDSKEEALSYFRRKSKASRYQIREKDIKLALKELYNSLTILNDLGPGITILGSHAIPEGSTDYENVRNLGLGLAKMDIPVFYRGYPGTSEAVWKGFQDGRKMKNRISAKAISMWVKDYKDYKPTGDIRLGFTYPFEPKIASIRHSWGYAVFPGGLATLDELFDVICLIQTRKIKPFPVVLINRKFWAPLEHWIKYKLLSEKVISKENLKLFQIVDTHQEALRIFEDYYLGRLVNSSGSSLISDGSPDTNTAASRLSNSPVIGEGVLSESEGPMLEESGRNISPVDKNGYIADYV
ncbi:MAG: LOG family protein, partial [Candidatus Omnitrophica bacterium]|nr:LOG family protein [Candidatus Omnitrophota bacterium]